MFIQNTGCVVRHGPCRFHLSDKTKGSDCNLPLPSNGAKLHKKPLNKEMIYRWVLQIPTLIYKLS